MKKNAVLLLKGLETETDLTELESKIQALLSDQIVKVVSYENNDQLLNEAEVFYNSSNNRETSEGWSVIKEDEVHKFFVLYMDLDFNNENYRLEELWTRKIERYLFSSQLNNNQKWKLFCGNDLSKNRIYIAPVCQENLTIIKSLFRIFLNKQIDGIPLNRREDIDVRYFLTALELPYRVVDSSERLDPACSNIYKQAGSLEQNKLYLSSEVLQFLPPNISRNLRRSGEDGQLYSYSFNLLT